ncbi:hypothetical protein SLEP1_g19858 [Rubroshorea leprosula]|uniref:Uncharacterized protein n=1 Tax=Rubroshorea leprosula TaxID=152421 RepID=A0AAV5J9R0_9ROSI|nr:hypothetical protein SLEP1_g19858 [Rubroshorea leprosula]
MPISPSPSPSPSLAATPAPQWWLRSPPSHPPPPPPPRNNYVIAALAVFCTIFLLLSYFRVRIRLCCSNNNSRVSRDGAQRRRLDEANTYDPCLQIYSRRLEYSITQSLPISQFKHKDKEEGPEATPSALYAWGNSKKRTGLNICPIALMPFT